MPAVVWRLEEHCLPELVVAAVARDPDVSHAAAAPGRFPGWLAEALWLVLEQRNGHLDDHAPTSRYESMVCAIADVAHIIRQLWGGTQEQPYAGSRSCSPGLTPA